MEDRSTTPSTHTRRDFLRQVGGYSAAVAGVGLASQLGTWTPARAGSAEAGGELVITSSGGTLQETLIDTVVNPFEAATGSSVSIVTGTSATTLAQLQANPEEPGLDVVQMDIAPLFAARKDNLLQPLDVSALSNHADLFPAATDPDGYWVGRLISMTGIAYNTELVPRPPTSWADLWSPEFAGHVAIPHVSGTAGWQFLAMVSRINGGSESDIGPGIKALSDLRSDLAAIWTGGDEMGQLLTTGEAWIGPWFSGRFNQSQQAGAPVAFVRPEEGAIAIVATLCMPAGASNVELGHRYIDFFISPEIQYDFCRTMLEGPTNRLTDAFEIPEGTEVALGDEVDELATFDWETIAEGLPDWISQFERDVVG